MTSSFTVVDILRFAAGLSADQPARYVAIGGVPRSGTSSCERWLHSFEGFFIADEFHGLHHAGYLDGMHFKIDYMQSEAELWVDAEGKTWRATTLEEIDHRRLRSELINLLLYTRSSKFVAKKPEELRVFGFKLPIIETFYNRVWPLFSKTPIPFIYCARDPTAILTSQWMMPWVYTDDEVGFSNIIAHQLKQSLIGLDNVAASGCLMAIWRTPSSEADVSDVIDKLGFTHLAGARLTETGLVDEWPAARRRAIRPLSQETVTKFASRPEVAEYRERLNV